MWQYPLIQRMLPTGDGSRLHRLAPPRGHVGNPFRGLRLKRSSQACILVEVRFRVDAFSFDAFTKFSACDAARGTNTKCDNASFSLRATGHINPIAPIRWCFGIPIDCKTPLKHVSVLTDSA